MAFDPRAIELRGGFALDTDPDAAFPLFSPLGEKAWVPEWDPELLHPPGVAWERGQLFRTIEERGEAIWIVTALDRERREVEYQRIEPGRYVARVRVSCTAGQGGGTEVSVRYAFVGLSDSGNREIDAMRQDQFDAKMQRWLGWIEKHLAG